MNIILYICILCKLYRLIYIYIYNDACRAQVQLALQQLVANPLFAANPKCLGDLIQNLIQQSAVSPVPTTVESPSTRVSTPASTPMKGKEGLNLVNAASPETYKAYWSKFKRPAPSPTPEAEEVQAADTEASEAAAAVEVPESEPCVSGQPVG